MWSACLGHLSIARDAFSHQGELDYCGFMEAIASEAYDRLAEPEEGWRHRVIAQESLSRAGDMQRLASVLTGAVRGELMRGELESALSLETIAVDFNRSTGRQPLVAEAMTRRALILYKAHSPLAASALDAARQATAKVPDEAMRASIEADVNLAEAVIVRDHDPHRAVTLLTAAIDYHNGHQHAMWLPLLYLERGRAFRAAGQTEEAFKEFELGIQEVEKQRTSIVPPDLRAAFFDTEPDLFAEAVDLLIDRGDVEGAYEIVERGRARTLREHLTGTATVELAPLSAAAVRRSLGAHELLIEYQLLPSRLAIFYADARSVSVQIVPIQPDDPLPAVQQRASRVWNILMAPIAGHLEEAALLTVVPDRFLYAVPFAALFDPDARQFLVQKKTLRIAPSGMFLTQAARPLRTTPALVIGDPARDDDSEPLPYAEEEARAVARLHGSSPLLGNAATREAFLAAAPESALIHYAGHTARTIADDNEQLLFAGAGGGNAVSSREIARLHLPKTSLVVLAACGTIRGSVDRVEGVPGVARAFLSAGVPSVVGTLWNVPDRRAVTLFSEFHRGVGKGRLPAIALSEAQRTLLGRTGAAESHPFVWAGVELVGR
jgi:tetratricopeptide (TPR) repeat protein